MNNKKKTIPKIKIKNNTIVPASPEEDGFRSPRTPRKKTTQTILRPNLKLHYL